MILILRIFCIQYPFFDWLEGLAGSHSIGVYGKNHGKFGGSDMRHTSKKRPYRHPNNFYDDVYEQ